MFLLTNENNRKYFRFIDFQFNQIYSIIRVENITVTVIPHMKIIKKKFKTII